MNKTLVPLFESLIFASLDCSSSKMTASCLSVCNELLDYDGNSDEIGPLLQALGNEFSIAMSDLCLPVIKVYLLFHTQSFI